MSLDVAKLEKVRELAGGIVQARCPACAEGGGDRRGEHLRVYPDGRYGCCVHPKDSEHRKRVFVLVGEKTPRGFSIRVATAGKTAIPARSIKQSLTDLVGTLGTGVDNSAQQSLVPIAVVEDSAPILGTLGTPIFELRAYARGEVLFNTPMRPMQPMHKDSESGVPGAPRPSTEEKLPFTTAGGTLVIPFDSPPRYHWWKGGQSVKVTLAEIRARTSGAGEP
jgi:hypothetical protein